MEPNRKSNRPKSRQSIAHVLTTATPLDRDNATADIATLQRAQIAGHQATKRKSRGKSLGPGGLEALQESTGNATKNINPFQIKSILKPTIPLTPPKVIPSFDELRKRSTGKSKSPGKVAHEELLIDFSTPGPRGGNGDVVMMTGAQNVLDPFSRTGKADSPRRGATSVNAPDEEQGQEAELKRQAEKQAILDRRAARRKSLANRRVSFAPEATLHTWSVMELAEDSTTSSASNSTRRQSSMTAAQSPMKTAQSPAQTPQPEDRPRSPLKQTQEPQVCASPAQQGNPHQKKRRRQSSAVGEGQIDASIEEVYSSSPSGDVMAESSPIRIDDSVHSDDTSDTDGDTAMSMDESTSHTITSQDSASSTQSSLDERLRRAASQAGTRGIEYDEHGDDLPMELATSTITRAFQPFQDVHNGSNNNAMEDQENVNPFSPAFKAHQTQREPEADQGEDDTQDISMDVTKAVGGIVPNRASPGKGRRKSVANRRRSSVGRRRSSGGDSSHGDESMDFTTVGGGILPPQRNHSEEEASDEELTMEFTNVIGGVLGRPTHRDSIQSVDMEENETMDMAAAVGGILAPIEEQTEPQTDVEDERTMAMEMTKAVGAILPSHLTPLDKKQAKSLMQEETDAGQLSFSPVGSAGKPEATQPQQYPLTSIASETGSPDFALKPRLSGRSRQSLNSTSTTPKSSPKRGTPKQSSIKPTHGTPTKQVTPLPSRGETPNKTPLSANVTQRGASPKKLFKNEIKARASPASKPDSGFGRSAGLFARDEETGRHTPRVVLKAPKPSEMLRRRSSGVGIDKEGFGSPKVADLLDRRSSIGDATADFRLDGKVGSRLRFEDPVEIEREIDAERAEEHRRESGRHVMEQEANEQQDENATLQLKDMIESMTPKKNKPTRLKGRKSLAVGGAKGLLGKRPAELDLEEEDVDTPPKRLKSVSREASPVKKVHLPKPPSKEETTGRLTRSEQMRLDSLVNGGSATPATGPSPVKTTAVSPQAVGRFKDVPLDTADTRPESFEDKLDNVVDAIDVSTATMHTRPTQEEKISLQSFLNMTNIHFIELSTTKRRHTMAVSTPNRPSHEGPNQSTTELMFTAAATTLPLIELYQHATRELKSYISAGRKIIRSIETETLAEQPLLFREYVDARPDIKVVMDNQFRNGKANARLQSKEGWYSWRAQLVDGLKKGLEGIKTGMVNDGVVLDKQQQVLDNIVPDLSQRHELLREELQSLQDSISELDNVDSEALDRCRRELQVADENCHQKTALLETLRQQMADKEEALASAADLKTELQEQIAEADRVRLEYRGWPAADVAELIARVGSIEERSGWKLSNAEQDSDELNDFGVALTMTFMNQLRLFFYPSAFVVDSTNNGRRRSGRKSRSVSGPTAPISLTYAPAENEDNTANVELPTEKRFFLQLMRSQLHAFTMMPKGSVAAQTVLQTVSKGWNMASQVSEEIRLLTMAGVTSTSIVGDEKFGVKVMLMMQEKSRIDVEFGLSVTLLGDGDFGTTMTVSANGVYGPVSDLLNGSKGRKVQQALAKEVANVELGRGAWIGAIHGFEAWITAQGSSKPEPQPEKAPSPTPASVPTQAPAPPRSPLAAKKTNMVQKKALPLPVSKQRAERQQQQQKESEKENLPPPPSSTKHTAAADQITSTNFSPVTKAAIPPELQEAMMHTPIKRIGALRRSPM